MPQGILGSFTFVIMDTLIMDTVVIKIEPSKKKRFLNFIRDLDYLQLEEENGADDYTPATKEEILDSLRQGLKESKMMDRGEIPKVTLEEFLDEL